MNSYDSHIDFFFIFLYFLVVVFETPRCRTKTMFFCCSICLIFSVLTYISYFLANFKGFPKLSFLNHKTYIYLNTISINLGFMCSQNDIIFASKIYKYFHQIFFFWWQIYIQPFTKYFSLFSLYIFKSITHNFSFATYM